MAGRPRKTLTKEQQAELGTLAAVLNMDQIADYFGMIRGTLAKIMQRDPEIGAVYRAGKARAISNVGGGLLQKALDGDTTSQIFYLKTQAGWREVDRHDDNDAPPVTINFNAAPAKGEIDVTESGT